MIQSVLTVVGGVVVGAAALYATISILDRTAWYLGYCRYYLVALSRSKYPSAKEFIKILRAAFSQCMQNYGYDLETSCTNRVTGETIIFKPPFKITITKKG